jgi:hypothetical protein
MIRDLCIGICLGLVTATIPLRAANRPHAGADSQMIKNKGMMAKVLFE